MTDKTLLSKQQERGEQARWVLENDLVQEAFEKIEQTIREGWENSRADEKEQRENAYIAHRLLQNFQEHFKQVVATGDHARKQLLSIKDESKLKKVFRNG